LIKRDAPTAAATKITKATKNTDPKKFFFVIFVSFVELRDRYRRYVSARSA